MISNTYKHRAMAPKAIILAKHFVIHCPAKENLKLFIKIVLTPDNKRVSRTV